MAYNDYGTTEVTYQGHIEIIDGLIPSGDSNFPLMQANSIWVPERWNRYINNNQENPYTTGIRLDKRIQQLEDDKVNREGGDLLIGKYYFNNSIAIGELFEGVPLVDGCMYATGIALKGFFAIWGNTGEDGIAEISRDGMEVGVPSRFFKDVIIGIPSVNASLTINGDLIVSGTTITENHKTLDIQDNILVLNKSEEGLSGINDTGLVLCSANQDTYFGIILNTSDQTVRLGVGNLSRNNTEGSDVYGNKFEFKEGEGLPFALRTEEFDENNQSENQNEEKLKMKDDSIPVWNINKHCFAASEYTPTSLISHIRNLIRDESGNFKYTTGIWNGQRGKYTNLINLEKAIIDGHNFPTIEQQRKAGVEEEELRYSLPELRKYLIGTNGTYQSIQSLENRVLGTFEETDNRLNIPELKHYVQKRIIVQSIQNNILDVDFNTEYVIQTSFSEFPTLSFNTTIKDDECKNVSLMFYAQDAFEINDVRYRWSAIKPKIHAGFYYKLDFIYLEEQNILASWTVYGNAE